MNLNLLFKIFAGLMGLFTLGGIIAPDSMLKGFGMEYSTQY